MKKLITLLLCTTLFSASQLSYAGSTTTAIIAGAAGYAVGRSTAPAPTPAAAPSNQQFRTTGKTMILTCTWDLQFSACYSDSGNLSAEQFAAKKGFKFIFARTLTLVHANNRYGVMVMEVQ